MKLIGKTIVLTGLLLCDQSISAGEISTYQLNSCDQFSKEKKELIVNTILAGDFIDDYNAEETISTYKRLFTLEEEFSNVQTVCKKIHWEAIDFTREFFDGLDLYTEKESMAESIDRLTAAYAKLNKIWLGKKVLFNQEKTIAYASNRSKILLSKTLDLLSIYNEKAAPGSQGLIDIFNYFYEKTESAEIQNTGVIVFESTDQRISSYQLDFLYKVLDIMITDLKARRPGTVLYFSSDSR